MSEAIVSTSINAFPALLPVTILSPLCGMVHGDLENLQLVGGDLIASFGCHCTRCGARETRNVALPGDLAPELRALVGEPIGIMRRAERYVVRRIA